MVKVVAQKCGYYGGKIREVGEEFELANDHWLDEMRRPKWVGCIGELAQEGQLVEKAATKGKKGQAGTHGLEMVVADMVVTDDGFCC